MVQLSVSTELKDKPRVTKHQSAPLDDTCEVPLESQTIVHLRETSGCCSKRAAGLAIAVVILLAVGGATLAIYLTQHPAGSGCIEWVPGCPEDESMEWYRFNGDEDIGKDFDVPYHPAERNSQSGDQDSSQSGHRKGQSSESNSGSDENDRRSGDHNSQSGDRKGQSSESNSGSGERDSNSGSDESDRRSGDHNSQSGDRKGQSSESNSGSGEHDSNSGGESGSRSGESGDRSRSDEENSGGSSESEDRPRSRHHGRRERPIKYDRDGHHPIFDRRPVKSWQWRFQKHQPGKACPHCDTDGHPRRPIDHVPMMP